MSQSDTPMPVIDPQQLSLMTGADVSLGIEVIYIFRQQTEMWSRMLDARAPPGQWADAAHSLKGSALSIGAMRLAHACAAAEILGRRHEERPVSPVEAGIAISDIKDQIGPAIEGAARLAHQLSLSGRFSLS